MQPISWLRNTPASSLTSVFHNRGYLRDPGFDNGNLVVKVFTNQTSQVSSADIQVLVSVRAAENLEFANPRELPGSAKFFRLQNDEYNLEDPTRIGVETKMVDKRYDTHIGEVVHNLRTVLRRRNFYRFLPTNVTDPTALTLITNYMNRLPLFPGYDPVGVDLARNNANTLNIPYNWVSNMPYTWLASCYLGCRGSVNWYATPMVRSLPGKSELLTLGIQRAVRTITRPDYVSSQGTDFINNTLAKDVLSRWYINNVPAINSGGCETFVDTSGTLPTQLPYYSRFRMRQCDPTKAVLGSSIDDSDIDNMVVTTNYLEDAGDTESIIVDGVRLHFGIGTDFTFLFFLNVPVIYVYGNPSRPL
jgi:hypothetical protein